MLLENFGKIGEFFKLNSIQVHILREHQLQSVIYSKTFKLNLTLRKSTQTATIEQKCETEHKHP